MKWFKTDSRTIANEAANVPEVKTSPQTLSQTAPLVALDLPRHAAGMPASFTGLSREGFRRNPVVYRCVRMLGEMSASVPLSCPEAVSDLLCGSSPTDGAASVLEALYGHLAITGSAYLELVTVGERPVAIRALRPDTVSPATDTRGRSVGWQVEDGGRPHSRKRVVRFDPVTHRSVIMALHLFDPLGHKGGMGHGPLEACTGAVDIHNEGARWTKSLLDNAACPSGALVYRGQPGAERLTDAQFERLRSELAERHSGARSAGRPLLLEGGLDWTSMSLSPADMDFIEARREAAREIALAFGVPPMLLGIPGDNTYSNYREANLALWRQTILPLVTKTAQALTTWLRPWMGDEITISPDLDGVPALSAERDALWTRLSTATFLTDAERRQLAGLPATDGEVTDDA